MRAVSLPWLLCSLSLAACQTGCSPALSCGFGERQTWQGCEAVDQFYINIDERLQIVGNTSRRGIGVNACTFEPLGHDPQVEDQNCSTYVFEGEALLESVATDAGGLIVGLPTPVLMAPDDEGGGCYDSDLLPSRSDLFEAGEAFAVAGLGGAAYPDFEAHMTAPATLTAELPDELQAGAALPFVWVADSADLVVASVVGHDADTNMTTHIGCVFDDAAGEGEVPEQAISALPSTDDVSLFLYRQDWQHLEPSGFEGVIDIVATSSVTRVVPLRD